MKLSDWARREGICYRTAYNLFKNNKLPVPSKQLDTGTILVSDNEVIKTNKFVIYARVSSHDQKEDLGRLITKIERFLFNKWIYY